MHATQRAYTTRWGLSIPRIPSRMVSSHLGRRMVATPPGGQSGRLGVAPPLGVAGRVIPADPSGRRGGRHQTRDGRSGLSQYVTARGGMVTRTSFAGLSRLVLVLTDYEWDSTLKGILRGNGFQRVPVAKCFLFGCSRAHVYCCGAICSSSEVQILVETGRAPLHSTGCSHHGTDCAASRCSVA